MKIVEEPISEYKVDVIKVSSAKYIGDFVIRVYFNDGHEKLVDFKPFLTKSQHPSIRSYLKEDLSENFQINNGNLQWGDFELIFPISDLYQGSIS